MKFLIVGPSWVGDAVMAQTLYKLIKDSKLLEEAGIFSIVLECVEMKLAKKITQLLKIPTIGIGSSVNCDGQVLVIDDLIGLSESKFRFVKKYANINQVINLAVKKYKSEVLKKEFPKAKHSFKYSKTIP